MKLGTASFCRRILQPQAKLHRRANLLQNL